MTTQYPQLDRFLAIQNPRLLTCPNLHFLIGSSITTDKSRATLKLVANTTIAIATLLNPEATVAIAALRLCFQFLDWLGRSATL
ncbi:hypothetical protein CKA32_005424 [Geitlerinema sp. FC II]|nr:hypothetical protein CKA32_005424 [Geitlerinema sp. FC II]